ncbi:hypothetical protein T07_6133 [Trichinella nelsoni]|uniref:Uncharacterized protein n=1 Tax=Trichinella nelsoni TaxID=6336 RepID=A0A0V0RWD2_9BILA|nr:hypothetical protein T07_6133 [Trichinella nelsoni]
MVLSFITLDCAGLAAYVIWTYKNPDWNARKSQHRRLFLIGRLSKAIEQIGTATSTERSEASKDEKHIYR